MPFVAGHEVSQEPDPDMNLMIYFRGRPLPRLSKFVARTFGPAILWYVRRMEARRLQEGRHTA